MKYSKLHQQRGVTLVVSLVILITLTLLGVTSIQRTTTELAMSGNQREAGLMFQAAELGLVASETFINGSTTNSDFNDDDTGLITVASKDADYEGPSYFEDTTWGARSTLVLSSIDAKEQPRYMIEYMGDRFENAFAIVNIDSYGSQQTGSIVSIYRSTSRGMGKAGNSYRYLQSYFGKDAP